MKSIFFLTLIMAFRLFSQTPEPKEPNLKLETQVCEQGCVANRAFLRITLIGKEGLPVKNGNVWLESADKMMQKHFVTASSGLYETFVEDKLYELTIRHDSSILMFRQFLRPFHSDSSYFLTYQFSDVAGEEVQKIIASEPILIIDEPEYLEVPSEFRHRSNGNEILTEKPVIYLYAENKIDFQIELNLIGEKSFTYPIDQLTHKTKVKWKGRVNSKGEITIKEQKYPYLFWDGLTPISEEFDQGFCISSEETISFLEDKLSHVGLNEKEITDFVTYWAPRMEQNDFNLVRFYQNEMYENKIAAINCMPKPETEIRLFMVYQPVRSFKEIKPQILTTYNRQAFVLVEWGGSELTK